MTKIMNVRGIRSAI